MSGNLSERIPVSGLDHPFDKLAAIANSMLDEIEVLVTEMAGVGNEIAHDLRTPLTRVRISLERGRANAKTLEELQSVADRAIGALDQSLTVITALLRITEIENSRGKASLAEVAPADLVREVGDLYDPIAEDKSTSRCGSRPRITQQHIATVTSCSRPWRIWSTMRSNSRLQADASIFLWPVAKTKTSFGSRTRGKG